MGLLKFMVVGAAVAYGINHVTKKREDGTSILDEWVEKAPEWMEQAKDYATNTINNLANDIKQSNTYTGSEHS